MDNSLKVRVKKQFTNPLSGRRLKIDDVLNVPKNQFWLRRIKAGDCELEKRKAKAKKPEQPSGKKADVKIKSKGSK